MSEINSQIALANQGKSISQGWAQPVAGKENRDSSSPWSSGLFPNINGEARWIWYSKTGTPDFEAGQGYSDDYVIFRIKLV